VTWFRIEGKMPQHAKYAPLSDTAFRLAITAGCWCSENMTDGLIPKAMVAVLTAAPRGKKLTDSVGSLVRAGIWEERGEHWYLHDFLDWNMSREQWLKRVAAASAGGNAKASRSASKSAPHSTPPPLANVCHVADQVECQTAAKTLPGGLPCALPESESESESDSDPDLSAAASQRPDKLGKNEAEAPTAQRLRRKTADPMALAMAPRPNVEELFEAYRSESGKSGATLDGARAQLFVRLASEGVTVEQVREAVRGAKLDPWARDEKNLSVNVILSTADQREKYISLAHAPPRPKGVVSPRQPNGGGFSEAFLAAGKAGQP
jgi:hypothetical protein